VAGAQNVEIVRRWFDAMQEGEVGLELFGPDARIDNTPEFPITGPYVGRDGVAQWWADLAEVIDEMRIENVELTAIDDHRVLSVQRVVGTFSNTGIPVDESWAAIIQVEDGLLVHATGYASRARALEAAGA
jgi:ketosteroid isomerase-like protein